MKQREIDNIVIMAYRGSLVDYDTHGFRLTWSLKETPFSLLKQAYEQAMKRRHPVLLGGCSELRSDKEK